MSANQSNALKRKRRWIRFPITILLVCLIAGWIFWARLKEPMSRWLGARVSISLGLAKEVQFVDPALEVSIRSALHKPTGPITDRELAKLTYPLDDAGRMWLSLSWYDQPGEHDLSGIEYCKGIQRLSFGSYARPFDWTISDLSPLGRLPRLEVLEFPTTRKLNGIKQCTNLRELRLGRLLCKLPPLDALTKLEVLEITYTELDLSGISQCTNLRQLRWKGAIGDLRPLRNLTNLQVLEIERTLHSLYKVDGKDLRPLSNLASLQKLSLVGFGSRFDASSLDLHPLSGLTNLEKLHLQINQIDDLSPLSGMSNLKELLLGANEISDLSPLSGLNSLRVLFLEDNQIRDIRPLGALVNLLWLSLGQNQISDLSPLANLKDLRRLDLDANQIQNVSSLAKLMKIGEWAFGGRQRYDLQQVRRLGEGGTRHSFGVEGTVIILLNNQISDISPLVENSGIGAGDVVDLRGNPLGDQAYYVHIPALQNRGVKVQFNRKPSGELLTFADENLELAIRKALAIPERPIYESDELGRLKELEARGAMITALNGIEHCRNLQKLDLQNNRISDLSPISELTNLRQLRLTNNQIDDLGPLVNLTNLTRLYLQINRISDLSPISKLTNLRELWLAGNKIDDRGPLVNLTNLTCLDLQANRISDLNPISKLTNLRELWLNYNKIGDLGPLVNLTNLTRVYLGGNQISDLSPLANLTELRALNLAHNEIQDIGPLLGLTKLGLPEEGWATARVNLTRNPLNQEAFDVHIPALKARGVEVRFTPKP